MTDYEMKPELKQSNVEHRMSTRAIQLIKKANVPFQMIKYEHLEKGTTATTVAAAAAAKTGFALEQTIKTLVAEINQKQYVLALMPGDRQLDVKKLARFFNGKRASLVDTGTAERLTGYVVGGISPFGLKHPMPAVMNDSLLRYKDVIINGGQRGIMLKMAPAAIADALKCKIAPIAR
jgi:Cys-tRNA(Pro)/Cys-tRNA(Cys) deacylase